jgi:hypothetical protein
MIMFKILDFTKHNLTAIQAKGKIEKPDYDKVNALLEKNEREYDTQRLYIEIDEIEKITPAALWEDFKMYFKQIRKFERVAIVADSSAVENLSKLSKPFISGELKFFNIRDASKAKEWIMKNSD